MCISSFIKNMLRCLMIWFTERTIKLGDYSEMKYLFIKIYYIIKELILEKRNFCFIWSNTSILYINFKLQSYSLNFFCDNLDTLVYHISIIIANDIVPCCLIFLSYKSYYTLLNDDLGYKGYFNFRQNVLLFLSNAVVEI